MSSNQRIKAILTGVFVVLSLVVASCGPLAARVDTSEGEAVVGVRHGMELSLEAVPPTGVPVLCHGQAPAGVASIELYVNGMFIGRSVNTAGPGTHEFNYFTAEMSFQPDGPGAYELRCRTQDHEGHSINSADVTIFLTGEAVPSPPPPEVPTATPTETEVPPEVPTATPTATGVPTHTPTSTAVPTDTPTATPSSTPTTQPRVVITEFEVDKTQITKGECVRFNWRVEAPTEIYFDGQGVTDNPGSADRCPTSTRAFELVANGYGGPVTASITVVVIQPSPSPGDTQGPVITRVAESSDHMDWPDAQCLYCQYPNVVTISAHITDPSGVKAAKLTYRINRPGAQWQSIPMTQAQTGMYSATIGPAQLITSLNPPVPTGTCTSTSILQYYVQAFDGLDNASQSPTGTVTVHYCYIVR